MVAPTALLLYMKKIKNTEIMKTLSNVGKSMRYLNIVSFPQKTLDSMELLFYSDYIVSHHRCSRCIWKTKKYRDHENSFESWEKYGMFERSFISIENIGSHGIILPYWHIVAPVPLPLGVNDYLGRSIGTDTPSAVPPERWIHSGLS